MLKLPITEGKNLVFLQNCPRVCDQWLNTLLRVQICLVPGQSKCSVAVSTQSYEYAIHILLVNCLPFILWFSCYWINFMFSQLKFQGRPVCLLPMETDYCLHTNWTCWVAVATQVKNSSRCRKVSSPCWLLSLSIWRLPGAAAGCPQREWGAP